jgi:hypothetical protein
MTWRFLLIRFVLVWAFLGLLNEVYLRSGMHHHDLRMLGATLHLRVDTLQKHNDILYFGESSNATFSANDQDRRSISQLLAERLPDRHIGTLDRGAIHASTYLALAERINTSSSVKQIVVTLNLRSFGADWIHSGLESEICQDNVMYSNYPALLKRLMVAAGGYDNKETMLRKMYREYQWRTDALPDYVGASNVRSWERKVGEMRQSAKEFNDTASISLAKTYVRSYGFLIDTLTNPRIADFDELVEVCRKKKIELILNLMPENMDYARRYCGLELPKLMRQNAEILKSRYVKRGVRVVDNLELVKGEDFVDQNWTTEHYNQIGRRLIANQLKAAFIPSKIEEEVVY